MKKTKNIIRKYLYMSIAAGVMMGLIFPPFASFFTTYKKESYGLPFSILCILAGVIVGLLSFAIGKVTLIKAITVMKKNLDLASQGDLTVRMEVNSKDEIGQISQAFNQMMQSLEIMLREVEQLSSDVSAFAENLSTLAGNTNKNSERIEQETKKLTEGAKYQKANAEHIQEYTVNSLDKVSDGFEKVERMKDMASNSSETAMNGKNYVQEVINQFSWITETVTFAKDAITGLERRSNEISDFVDVISKIAKLTNLLALNASIEAARAGEAGKGFVVVAEEINKLASDSEAAAKQIVELIDTIQTETKETICTMEDDLNQVNSQITMIHKGGEVLDTLVLFIKDNNSDILELHDIYEEIKNMFQKIKEETVRIAEIIGNNVDGFHQVAEYSMEQHASVRSIAEDTKGLKELSKKLLLHIEDFKVTKR